MRKYLMSTRTLTVFFLNYTEYNLIFYHAVVVLPPPALTVQSDWEFPATSQPSLSPE